MKRLIAWFGFQKDALQKSFNLIKQTWCSTTLTIFTIVILLVLAAIFWLLTDIMQVVDLDWRSNKQITVYLKIPTNSLEQEQLLEKIKTTNGVKQAVLRSAADGLQMLKEHLEVQDVLSYLPENPLPALIEVTANFTGSSDANLLELKNTFMRYPNVESVTLDLTWLKSISLFIAVISGVLQVLMILISLALVLIITNALRLIIADRIDEINVLKFIGASDRYIRRPYLYMGCVCGFLAACLAIIGINIILLFMQSSLNDLLATYSIVHPMQGLSWLSSGLLLFLSMLIGWSGAHLAIDRYLRIVR